MDYGVAVIALASTVIATLLTLLPGLTPDDRARERILRDVKLFEALTEKFDTKELKDDIQDSIAKMLRERERRERERVWTWAAVALGGATGIMGILAILPTDGEIWAIIGLYLSISLGVALFFAIGLPIAAFIKFRREKRAKTSLLETKNLTP